MGLGKMETPLLEGTHKLSCIPRVKAEPGQPYLPVLEELLESQGVAVPPSRFINAVSGHTRECSST